MEIYLLHDFDAQKCLPAYESCTIVVYYSFSSTRTLKECFCLPLSILSVMVCVGRDPLTWHLQNPLGMRSEVKLTFANHEHMYILVSQTPVVVYSPDCTEIDLVSNNTHLLYSEVNVETMSSGLTLSFSFFLT